MEKFKVGDRVKCIDDSAHMNHTDCLKKDKIYTIKTCDAFGVSLEEDGLIWNENRFVLADLEFTYGFKDYKIRSFNLIDIYEKNPCKEEFKRLMEEWGADPFISWSEDPFENFPTLVKNIDWLLKNGFAIKEEKNIELKSGMRVENMDYNNIYIITYDNKLINIETGKYWSSTRSYYTLKELNDNTVDTFEVIKEDE